MIILLSALIIFCILMEGFFSGSELAIVSIDRSLLQHAVKEGSHKAQLLTKMLKEPELFIGATLFGTNLMTVTANFSANELFKRLFGEKHSMLSLLLVVPLILFFGEIIPKAYFRSTANTSAFKIVYPLRFFSILFKPVIIFLSSLGALLRRILTGGETINVPNITRKEFRMILDQERNMPTGDSIRRMLANLSDYMEKTVSEVTIPMINVAHCDPQDHYRTVVDIFLKSGFSRIPVYDHAQDEITGFINDISLLEKKNRKKHAREFSHKPVYIPENLALSKALIRLRREHHEIAAVSDEYGGIVGIVTMKDIVKEITGKLGDRYETDPGGYIQELSPNIYIADALLSLDELSSKTGVEIESLPFETIGGLMNYLTGNIPCKGDTCSYRNLHFTALRSRPQKVEMIKIEKK